MTNGCINVHHVLSSDYRNESYPSVTNIIDFMRFSVKFDDMESGINTFINDVNSGNNEPLKECFVPHGMDQEEMEEMEETAVHVVNHNNCATNTINCKRTTKNYNRYL